MTETKMPELLPCPFCGSSAVNPKIECFDEETGTVGGEFIYNPCCSNKKCILGHGHHLAFENEKESIAAWNTRSDLAKPVDVESLLRHRPENMTIMDADFYDNSYDIGWNEAVFEITTHYTLTKKEQP